MSGIDLLWEFVAACWRLNRTIATILIIKTAVDDDAITIIYEKLFASFLGTYVEIVLFANFP